MKVLALSNFAVSLDLEPISHCSNLRYLWLSGTTWTPMRIASLKPLASLLRLGWLVTPAVRVKDRSLDALHSLKALSEVRLSNSFSDEALNALAAALPHYDGRLLYLEIRHRIWQQKFHQKG